MRTLVDGSSLLAAHPTGVTVAVRALLDGGLLPIEGEATVVTYGYKRPATERLQGLALPWRHIGIPSKAVHALCGSGLTSFDRLFGPADRLLLPNLNIVGIPKIPYDLLVHDLSFLVQPTWFPWKTRAWHRLARPEALIRGAERLFAVSDWTKRELVDLLAVPAERITVVTVPAAPFPSSDAPRPLAEPYFLLFSAQDERKNARCAEIAFVEFAKTYPGWRLVLVGKQGAPAHPHTIHLPYLEATERVRWLKHAAALLYPSWYEGYGLPPQEARSLGVPVLAAGTGVVAETAPPGTVLLPPHLPGFWAEAMERIADGAATTV